MIPSDRDPLIPRSCLWRSLRQVNRQTFIRQNAFLWENSNYMICNNIYKCLARAKVSSSSHCAEIFSLHFALNFRRKYSLSLQNVPGSQDVRNSLARGIRLSINIYRLWSTVPNLGSVGLKRSFSFALCPGCKMQLSDIAREIRDCKGFGEITRDH